MENLEHAAKSPLGIAVLMLVSSFGGSWIKDRLMTEGRDTHSAAQIEALDKRLADHLQDAVSKRQFDEVERENGRRFDEIRADLKDIAVQLRTTQARH